MITCFYAPYVQFIFHRTQKAIFLSGKPSLLLRIFTTLHRTSIVKKENLKLFSKVNLNLLPHDWILFFIMSHRQEACSDHTFYRRRSLQEANFLRSCVHWSGVWQPNKSYPCKMACEHWIAVHEQATARSPGLSPREPTLYSVPPCVHCSKNKYVL